MDSIETIAHVEETIFFQINLKIILNKFCMDKTSSKLLKVWGFNGRMIGGGVDLRSNMFLFQKMHLYLQLSA